MTPPTASSLFRGVDLAAFAVALVTRARSAGVTVSASGAARLTEALQVLSPMDRRRLYWITRVTLVGRQSDLERFDAVFAAVFADAVLPLDPASRQAHRSTPGTRSERRESGVSPSRQDTRPSRAAPPWATRAGGPDDATAPAADTAGAWMRLPSPREDLTGEAFGAFDDADLRDLGRRLDDARRAWPERPSRRREPHRRGRVDLRATMRRARHTGFEPVRVARGRARSRPRRIVLVCDVSRSMRGCAEAYLHLMRAAVTRSRPGDAEVFAFSTRLTRLTPTLAHRSAEAAALRASERVIDRFGGTHIARSLESLLSSPHGAALRGAVVIIASDGWDSDDPADLARAVARIRRRAHRLVWLNPRAAAPGFAPVVGAMAAALPYCDEFLAAHTVPALAEALEIVGGS